MKYNDGPIRVGSFGGLSKDNTRRESFDRTYSDDGSDDNFKMISHSNSSSKYEG